MVVSSLFYTFATIKRAEMLSKDSQNAMQQSVKKLLKNATVQTYQNI